MKTLFAKAFLTVSLSFLLAGCSAKEAGWGNLGNGGVAPTRAGGGKLAASNGVLYAAFADWSASNKLSVMKFSDPDWVSVGAPGFTMKPVNDFIFAVDNGTPTVAFSAEGSVSGTEALNVMKYDGANWASVGNADFATLGDSSAAFNLAVSDGVPTVAFADADSQLHVQNASGGVWADVGGTVVSSRGQYPALTMFNGQITVLFSDSTGSTEHALMLVGFDGAGWVPLATSPLTLDAGYGSDTSLTVSNGTLYATFFNAASGPVMLSLKGGALESIGGLGSISNGAAVQYVTSAVYKGVPYVAFDDNSPAAYGSSRTAAVKRFDGTSWKYYGDPTTACDIDQTHLAVDQKNGRVYLTYSNCDGVMTTIAD